MPTLVFRKGIRSFLYSVNMGYFNEANGIFDDILTLPLITDTH